MKISELNVAGTLSGTEVLPIVQSGETKKVSIDDVVALAGGGSSSGINGLVGTGQIALGGSLINNTIIDANNFWLQFLNLGSDSKFESISDLNNDLLNGIGFVNPNAGFGIELYAKNNNTNTKSSLKLGNDYLQVINGSNLFGIYLDLTTENCYFGLNNNLSSSSNGVVCLFFDGNNGNAQFINTFTGNAVLNLDNTTNKYNLAYGGAELGIKNNNGNPLIYTSNQGTDSGLYLDFANGNFGLINNTAAQEGIWINDLFGTNKSIYIGFGDSTKALIGVQPNLIFTNYSSNNVGLKLDFVNLKYTFGATDTGIVGLSVEDDIHIVSLGDITGNGQGTIFGVDDNAEKLIGSANLTVGGTHSNSGLHLKINLGGTDYVIQLLNP